MVFPEYRTKSGFRVENAGNDSVPVFRHPKLFVLYTVGFHSLMMKYQIPTVLKSWYNQKIIRRMDDMNWLDQNG